MRRLRFALIVDLETRLGLRRRLEHLFALIVQLFIANLASISPLSGTSLIMGVFLTDLSARRYWIPGMIANCVP